MAKNFILLSFLVISLVLAAQIVSATAIIIPPPDQPTNKKQCKHGGWRSYGDMFKNQGDCVSFVVTGGRNAPDGPPIH